MNLVEQSSISETIIVLLKLPKMQNIILRKGCHPGHQAQILSFSNLAIMNFVHFFPNLLLIPYFEYVEFLPKYYCSAGKYTSFI